MNKSERINIDDAISLSFLNILPSPNFLVRAFRSGFDAYNSLDSVAHPELILWDVNMPEMEWIDTGLMMNGIGLKHNPNKVLITSFTQEL